MKVLVLCTNSDAAGAPIHVRTLISSLIDQVEFLAVFGEDGSVAQSLREMGVVVAVVPQMRSRISPLQDRRAFRELSRHAAAFRPDLIHAHSSKAGMLGRLLSMRWRIPCIYTVHGWGWRGLNPVAASLVYLLEKLLTFVPRSFYIYVSRSVEREAHDKLGILPGRGRVVYNGVVDTGVNNESAGPVRIVMPARVTSAKDHETLIKAFERLHFDSELILCGVGTDTTEFRARIDQWAPTRQHMVRTLGPRSDVSSLLHEAHIFALISNFEALPLSIIEAMSAAKAIVASDVGGVSELIKDDVDGYLVSKQDVEGTAHVLTRLQDPPLRSRLGAAARRRYMEEFTSSTMSNAILQAYRSAAIEVAPGNQAESPPSVR